MNPYRIQPFEKVSFFNKLLGGKSKRNCIIEINNLFASRDVQDIEFDDIFEITDRYRFNFKTKFHKELKDIYRKYLAYCINDKVLSDDEIKQLRHIKEVLFLTDKDVEGVNNEVVTNAYSDEVKNIIADGKVTDEEKSFLEKLQSDLKLPDAIAAQIYQKDATELYKNMLDKVLADELLSPEEDAELNALAKNLNIEASLDPATKNILDKHRLYWQIHNGNLPVVNVSINLQKYETCHFHTHIDWFETRTITKRIGYSGPTMRIKIAKGLYWRAGNLAIKPTTEDVLTKIDSGDLYLTSKRIIFMGSRGSKTIAMNKILNFEVYSNGVEIHKDSGKSPFFSFSENVEIFSMLLGRIISNP
jgi:hypothetical protein